jgi:hypothetical protein
MANPPTTKGLISFLIFMIILGAYGQAKELGGLFIVLAYLAGYYKEHF